MCRSGLSTVVRAQEADRIREGTGGVGGVAPAFIRSRLRYRCATANFEHRLWHINGRGSGVGMLAMNLAPARISWMPRRVTACPGCTRRAQ